MNDVITKSNFSRCQKTLANFYNGGRLIEQIEQAYLVKGNVIT